MEKVLLIISVALIIIVLLQSGKANDAGQIISGGNTVLLGKSKERGAEKFITRLTYALGFAFIIISLILSTLTSSKTFVNSLPKATSVFGRTDFIISRVLIILLGDS